MEGGPPVTMTATSALVLSVHDLDIDFWVDGVWYPAVIGADFELRRGEVLAIVGESGSGKSTTAMALLGLLPKNSHVRGSIELGGRQLVDADARELRSIRGREVSVIFQEPMTALNPVYTIGFQIGEMLRSHNSMSPKAARVRAIELLTMVEIPEPERRIDSYPHQLSGGQRQRAMIAQALACDPELLIADEPTTALDVTVQAEILKLMRDLKHRIDAAIVLITHDMGVVADMADRLLVMKDGRIVESGTADEVFHRPIHPYTIQLLDAVPHLGSVAADKDRPAVFGDVVPDGLVSDRTVPDGGVSDGGGVAKASTSVLEPKLLIADEPTSALDVSVQARVLELFQELQRDKGFACLFISHDLAVVEILARRIAVMHHGHLVELGTRDQILVDPQQAYTKRLIAAVPVPDPDEQRRRRTERDAILAAGIGLDDLDDQAGVLADLTEEEARARAKEAQSTQGPVQFGGV